MNLWKREAKLVGKSCTRYLWCVWAASTVVWMMQHGGTHVGGR